MIGWAVETLVAATALMLLVLALRRPVARRFGPNAAYCLWGLPALRMILPPIPDSWRPVDFAPIGAATEPGTVMMMVPVASIPALPQGWGMAGVPVIVMIAWAAGAVGFVGWHIVRHRRFCAAVLASDSGRRVAEGRVTVIRSPHAAGPLAFGIWRRYVAMPADFAERYDPREQALALAHELGHHARGDLLANWVALIVLGLHWFNPVAWVAFRAFRSDQEMACDAMVLGNATPAVRHAYALAIVKSAHGGAVSAACHLHSVNELKGRLIMLSKHRALSPAARRTAGICTATMALFALGVTASGTQAAETVRGSVESATGVDIAAADAAAATVLTTRMESIVRQAPAVPVDPAKAATPEAAAAPREPADASGKRTVIVKRIGKDGTVISQDQSEIIDVAEAKCGTTGRDRHAVSRTESAGGKARVIVCVDRIDRIVADAAEQAAAGREAEVAGRAAARAGLTAALSGLRAARASVEAQTALSPEQKREALQGIDEGMREVEQEIASNG